MILVRWGEESCLNFNVNTFVKYLGALYLVGI